MKILVIDDDPATTDLLKLTLQSTTAFILTSNSAREGIALAQKRKPDIILMDLMMEDMFGWEACKEIRAFSTTPILMISAVDSPEMIVKALDSGADDYIIKPVNSDILVAHINKALRRNYIGRGMILVPNN